MSAIKPFDFSRLPKISRQDILILDALRSFLPRIGFSDELGRSLRRLVGRALGTPFSFREEKITNIRLSTALPTLPKQGVYLVFGLAPLEEKAFLELDPFLAHVAIDRLLGGTGEPLTMVRPLTEIEEGVLSYVFLKILAEIFERCGRTARVHFRLEGYRSSSDEILSLVSGSGKEGRGVMISYRLTVGDRSGYGRLILPSPFVEKAFLEPMEGGQAALSERELQYYAARLSNLGFLATNLWAEVGSATLKAGELADLEAGDVVLLQKTGARLDGERLEGYLPLRLGRGECGSFRGQVVSGEGPLRLKLQGMELEHPV